MHFKTWIVAIAMTVLAGCAGTGDTVDPSLDKAQLAASGQAVIVRRGGAFLGSGVAGGHLFMATQRTGGNQFDLLSNDGLIPTTGYGYAVETVPAGTYMLSTLAVDRFFTSFGAGDPSSQVTLTPGDVVYLGDVQVVAIHEGFYRDRAEVRVTNAAGNARAYLAAQAPALAADLQVRLLTCGICVRR